MSRSSTVKQLRSISLVVNPNLDQSSRVADFDCAKVLRHIGALILHQTLIQSMVGIPVLMEWGAEFILIFMLLGGSFNCKHFQVQVVLQMQNHRHLL